VNGRCLPICDKASQRDPYGNCVIVCPPGQYANLRGVCQVPECPQGTRRNDRGECLPVTCDQGQERYNGQCVPICQQGMSRDDNGRCVPDQPTCPQGQRLNPDTNQCERIPPNIPKCNQNQIYSSVLRRCQDIPPPVHCDQGQYKGKDGRCHDINATPVYPQQPDCPPGYRPDGAGGCMRTFVPNNCPPGTYLNPRTRRCDMLQGTPVYPQQPDAPPAIRQPLPFNPAILRQLMPQGGNSPGANIQTACPAGTYRDNNGRCVGKQ
jgi:hypothetical protein